MKCYRAVFIQITGKARHKRRIVMHRKNDYQLIYEIKFIDKKKIETSGDQSAMIICDSPRDLIQDVISNDSGVCAESIASRYPRKAKTVDRVSCRSARRIRSARAASDNETALPRAPRHSSRRVAPVVTFSGEFPR